MGGGWGGGRGPGGGGGGGGVAGGGGRGRGGACCPALAAVLPSYCRRPTVAPPPHLPLPPSTTSLTNHACNPPPPRCRYLPLALPSDRVIWADGPEGLAAAAEALAGAQVRVCARLQVAGVVVRACACVCTCVCVWCRGADVLGPVMPCGHAALGAGVWLQAPVQPSSLCHTGIHFSARGATLHLLITTQKEDSLKHIFMFMCVCMITGAGP